MNPETLKDHSPLDEEAFVFGAFRLLPAQRILLEEGKPLHLGSRALDVLIALVESAGDTIHKDKLIARVLPDTFVGEGNLRFQVATLRKALGDGRGGNRFIANIPGRGYTFVAPVTREQEHADNALADGTALPDKPSLAVLPFQNMSGDAEQEYFVDGMVEEITTAIARLPWLFVIARNSSFIYKGKPVGVKQVAQELGVRYVLEGSVRKAGNRVGITGQLIDTTTAAHIWADRFDGAIDDIFELQDQVASNVAGAIEPKLRQSEIERAGRKPPANLTAYDLYLRALAQSYRYTEEGFAEAVVLARQALAIDPSYAPAAALVGLCRALQRLQGWGALSDKDISEAVRLARQALEAGRDDADTIGLAAWTLFYLAGEVAMAVAALDRALALNPNAAHAWLARGNIHALRNQPEAAIEATERARRLSPFDPYIFLYDATIAAAHLVARRFKQAIEWADRALPDQPRFTPTMRIKAAALAHLGRLDEARAELSRVLAINPKLTVAGFREWAHYEAPEVLELTSPACAWPACRRSEPPCSGSVIAVV
jgi:TolB-like protein/Flp pilus assembly protein TadD